MEFRKRTEAISAAGGTRPGIFIANQYYDLAGLKREKKGWDTGKANVLSLEKTFCKWQRFRQSSG